MKGTDSVPVLGSKLCGVRFQEGLFLQHEIVSAMGMGKILDERDLTMALPSGPPPSLRKDGRKPQKVVPVDDDTGLSSTLLTSVSSPVDSRSFQGGAGDCLLVL